MTFGPQQWLTAIAGVIVIVAIFIGAALLAGTADGAIGDDLVSRPTAVPGDDTVTYVLEEGASAGDIGNQLEDLGVIRSSQQFETLVTLTGYGSQLSAGEYQLPLGVSPASIIDILRVNQGVATVRVTFPEGIRYEEMAVIAEEAGIGTEAQFLEAVANAQLLPATAATLPEGHDLQGYLFPDTYILPEGASPAELVSLMIETFERRFDAGLRILAEQKGLNLHQALTIASIVEREAVIPEERALIAGVFLNRIAAGDLIGADATTQFAAALDPASVAEYGWWKLELTLENLENPSPYNTRLVPGIPPGPITNPGLKAIEAAANAAETDFYYFVADTILADGSHVFAESLTEHLANVERMAAQ